MAVQLATLVPSCCPLQLPTMPASSPPHARSRASPGMQPVPGSNPAAFLFWFAFITLCSFFVLNLYIGVVFFQFQR